MRVKVLSVLDLTTILLGKYYFDVECCIKNSGVSFVKSFTSVSLCLSLPPPACTPEIGSFPPLVFSGVSLLCPKNSFISYSCAFRCLYDSYTAKQENKIKCITHYFVRICTCMPVGVVSFERKVLSLDDNPSCNYYPKADFWSRSSMPLCHFKVRTKNINDDISSLNPTK